MKKIFRLEGLDCANCAAKIENAVGKLPGVTNANVNFMTAKMIIETDNSEIEGIIEQTQRIIKKYEPDVILKKGWVL